MQQLVHPELLRARILLWVEEDMRVGSLTPKAGTILEAVLYRDELPPADVPTLVGTGVRQEAGRLVSGLMMAEVLTANLGRAALHLVFPARLAGRWMPGLFQDPGV
jgi:hypothetical protein